MDRLIIASLPRDVRARYGEEISEILAESTRPVRDRADIVLAALGLRLGSALPALVAAALVSVALAGVAIFHSVANLQGGVGEIGRHWWSTFALAGFLTSISAAALLAVAQARARDWCRIT